MTKTFTYTQIGEHHTNHCEDYVLSAEIGTNKLLLAAMDGCTMGKESYFASALIGKVLRKIARDEFYKEHATRQQPPLKPLLEEVLRMLHCKLVELQNQLQLDKYELLSTLVLGIVDTTSREGEFLVIGDGLLCFDGQLFEFDQGNVPDYMGYHLHEPFDQWFTTLNQRLSCADLRDFSLSTDGVFTFSKFSQGTFPEIDPSTIITFLLKDAIKPMTIQLLKSRVLEIEERWGLRPADDLGVIRVLLDV